MGRKRKLRQATTVTFHAEHEILDEFDQQADEMGVSRAKLLRMCMEDHVGRDFEDWPERHRILHGLKEAEDKMKRQRRSIEKLIELREDAEARYKRLDERFQELKQEVGGR